ncbi:BA75_04189T0 [Komagataella pastoris]|uniref:BA75_04189T0 n=1 Tax=Komagataella pastoris TaxID=4922 RepID=A0A1B2JF72_PICPA|nr:BA75_04189T0 [Komagataella pastoris]
MSDNEKKAVQDPDTYSIGSNSTSTALESGHAVNHENIKKKVGAVSKDFAGVTIREDAAEKRPDIPPLGEPLVRNAYKTSFGAFFSRKTKTEPDAIATQPSAFDDPDVADVYYPKPTYQDYHRFDPLARWTWREETKIVRKLDRSILVLVCVLFFSLALDRSNISQANSAGFLTDLGLTTDDFNVGSNLFNAAFIITEIPSQMIGKRIGPDRWVPIQVCAWSIASGAQFWISGKKSFFALRFLTGLLEGGFIPDIMLYLSYFYTRTELPVRVGVFYCANAFSGILGSLIAIGLLKINSFGHYGWQYLFLIEGCITLIIGIAAFFIMVQGPTQTKSKLFPKGWFTEREETIMVNRLLRDDPSKSDMHNRQSVTPKELWKVLGDYDLWPIYALAMVFSIPQIPIKRYLTLTLRALEFTTTEINLLTIPASFLAGIMSIAISLVSEFFNEGMIIGILCQFWLLIMVIIEYTSVDKISPWGQYVLQLFIVGAPVPQPVLIGLCSRNSYSVRTRTISASLFNIVVQLSNIAGAYIYREDDKPLYKRGNRQLIGISLGVVALYVVSKTYYILRNKWKTQQWERLNEEEKVAYLDRAEKQNLGSKRLDFLFES